MQNELLNRIKKKDIKKNSFQEISKDFIKNDFQSIIFLSLSSKYHCGLVFFTCVPTRW